MTIKEKTKDMTFDEIIDFAKKIIEQNDRYISYIRSGKAFKDIYELIEKDMKQRAKDVISKWYSSYDRKFYKPTFSLYKSYKIESVDDDPIIKYSNDYIPKKHRVDRVNNDYIYDYIFSEGWHGGAVGIKGDDNLLYVPTPPKKFHAKLYNGDDNHPWSNVPWKHNRWVLADQTESIKDGLDNLNEYYQNEGIKKLCDIFIEEHFNMEV